MDSSLWFDPAQQASNTDIMLGKFQSTSSENYENYLAEIGMGVLMIQALTTTKFTVEIKQKGSEYIMTTSTSLKSVHIKFKLDEEFEEEAFDGSIVKSVIRKEKDNKLVQTQVGGGNASRIERDFDGDTMTVKLMAGAVVATQVFTKICLLLGKFQLTSSENYDEYLRHMGAGFVMRKLLTAEKPTIEIKEEGCEYIMITSTSFKSIEIKFKLDEEFEEETLDGSFVKSLIHKENEYRFVQTQRNEYIESRIERDLDGDTMTVKLIFGAAVVATQIFTKVTEEAD